MGLLDWSVLHSKQFQISAFYELCKTCRVVLHSLEPLHIGSRDCVVQCVTVVEARTDNTEATRRATSSGNEAQI